MNTKAIPVIIMLIGGCVSCAASLIRGVSMHSMLFALIITLIIFYILGHIIRIVINKFFGNILNPETEKSEEAPQTEQKENTDGETDDTDAKQDVEMPSEETSSDDEI